MKRFSPILAFVFVLTITSKGNSLANQRYTLEDEKLYFTEEKKVLGKEESGNGAGGESAATISFNGQEAYGTLEATQSGSIDLNLAKDGEVRLSVKGPNAGGTPIYSEIIRSSESEEVLKILPKNGEGARIRIRLARGGFEIEANGNAAYTKFPLSVDIKSNALSIQTPSGNINLVVLPDRVVHNLIKNRKIDTFISAELESGGAGGIDKLVYKIAGFRKVKLFGRIPIPTRVESVVGAGSGDELEERVPFYLSRLWFVFTS